MYTLGKIQDGKEVELTVAEALANDKREGKIGLFNLCDIFTCYFLLRNFLATIFES